MDNRLILFEQLRLQRSKLVCRGRDTRRTIPCGHLYVLTSRDLAMDPRLEPPPDRALRRIPGSPALADGGLVVPSRTDRTGSATTLGCGITLFARRSYAAHCRSTDPLNSRQANIATALPSATESHGLPGFHTLSRTYPSKEHHRIPCTKTREDMVGISRGVAPLLTPWNHIRPSRFGTHGTEGAVEWRFKGMRRPKQERTERIIFSGYCHLLWNGQVCQKCRDSRSSHLVERLCVVQECIPFKSGEGDSLGKSNGS
jgi:hypothetical protein